MGNSEIKKTCPLSVTGQKVAHHSRADLNAQVHLRDENHQLCTIILRAPVDIPAPYSAIHDPFPVILMSKWTSIAEKPNRKRVKNTSKSHFELKSAKINETFVQLNVDSCDAAHDRNRTMRQTYPVYPAISPNGEAREKDGFESTNSSNPIASANLSLIPLSYVRHYYLIYTSLDQGQS